MNNGGDTFEVITGEISQRVQEKSAKRDHTIFHANIATKLVRFSETKVDYTVYRRLLI